MKNDLRYFSYQLYQGWRNQANFNGILKRFLSIIFTILEHILKSGCETRNPLKVVVNEQQWSEKYCEIGN